MSDDNNIDSSENNGTPHSRHRRQKSAGLKGQLISWISLSFVTFVSFWIFWASFSLSMVYTVMFETLPTLKQQFKNALEFIETKAHQLQSESIQMVEGMPLVNWCLQFALRLSSLLTMPAFTAYSWTSKITLNFWQKLAGLRKLFAMSTLMEIFYSTIALGAVCTTVFVRFGIVLTSQLRSLFTKSTYTGPLRSNSRRKKPSGVHKFAGIYTATSETVKRRKSETASYFETFPRKYSMSPKKPRVNISESFEQIFDSPKRAEVPEM